MFWFKNKVDKELDTDAKYLGKIEKFMSKIPNKNVLQWLDIFGSKYKINIKFDDRVQNLEEVYKSMSEGEVYQSIVDYLRAKGDYRLIRSERCIDMLHIIGQIKKCATILEKNSWDKNVANELLGKIEFLMDFVIKLQKGLDNGKGHSKTKCK